MALYFSHHSNSQRNLASLWNPAELWQHVMTKFKAKIRKYFSGKLVLVQIIGGIGAFAGRSVAAYSASGLETWITVLLTQLGSFVGYVSTYYLGYWISFRKDYRPLKRSMSKDVVKLQMVEQAPNLITVISSALTQAALMETTEVGGSEKVTAVFSANVASWFGLHKIANFAAMATSNSLKKAWVDQTWKPGEAIKRLARWVTSPFKKISRPWKKRLPPMSTPPSQEEIVASDATNLVQYSEDSHSVSPHGR